MVLEMNGLLIWDIKSPFLDNFINEVVWNQLLMKHQ